jgi:hypothetical protein
MNLVVFLSASLCVTSTQPKIRSLCLWPRHFGLGCLLLHARERKYSPWGLEGTLLPLAFCYILKQDQALCFWAWLHEVVPSWRGREDGLVGSNTRQYDLKIRGAWGLRWTSYKLVTLLSVKRGGTWSPKSLLALDFYELKIVCELPSTSSLDHSFYSTFHVLHLSPKDIQVQTYT